MGDNGQNCILLGIALCDDGGKGEREPRTRADSCRAQMLWALTDPSDPSNLCWVPARALLTRCGSVRQGDHHGCGAELGDSLGPRGSLIPVVWSHCSGHQATRRHTWCLEAQPSLGAGCGRQVPRAALKGNDLKIGNEA